MAKRPKFKHMKKEEIALMERFIAAGHLKGHYKYDVPLQTMSEELIATVLPSEQNKYRYMTSKKIDCVVETWEEIWLIEVKYKVSPSALGQLYVYHDMYLEQMAPTKPLKLGILGEIDDPPVRKIAERRGIKVWIA